MPPRRRVHRRNRAARAVILARDATLTLDEAFSAPARAAGGATTALTRDEVVGPHILRVLQETHGRIEGPRGAAVRLGHRWRS
jgi:hypothetical protein